MLTGAPETQTGGWRLLLYDVVQSVRCKRIWRHAWETHSPWYKWNLTYWLTNERNVDNSRRHLMGGHRPASTNPFPLWASTRQQTRWRHHQWSSPDHGYHSDWQDTAPSHGSLSFAQGNQGCSGEQWVWVGATIWLIWMNALKLWELWCIRTAEGQHHIEWTGISNLHVTRDKKKDPHWALYRVSPKADPELQQQVEKAWYNGRIGPSNSYYNSPIPFIPIKDDGMLMCIHNWTLNQITRKNQFPIPHVEELVQLLGVWNDFSNIDWPSGYRWILISTSDHQKTAFSTMERLNKWTVLPSDWPMYIVISGPLWTPSWYPIPGYVSLMPFMLTIY